jgi:tRNA nucleotidyltransferase (CCA-adding enzyme)
MTLARYVQHDTLAAFAEQKVNLKADRVREYREQGNRLREKLAKHIGAHPDYGLVKMLNSGSVAKGTALATISDMDVAVYVQRASAPEGSEELVYWLRDRLKEAYSNLDDDQFEPQHHCVTLIFRSSNLVDVDVVPVLYDCEEENVGTLIVKDTGARVRTSVSRHIEFIRARKGSSPSDFAQVARLLKWWVGECKDCDPDFRFKSFLVELICAHLHDEGQDFSDYLETMEAFFKFIVGTGLKERIAFDDYYGAEELPAAAASEIEVFDPVNAENNVASDYDAMHREKIVSAALEAHEALADAYYAPTKERAIDDWKQILGPSFSG